jgi:hypothetical protein
LTARIFQIGFNRCGTSSLHVFFRKNGIPAVHWDQGRIALAFRNRMAAAEDPVADYPHILAFTDMMWIGEQVLIEAYKHFDYLHRFHPQARFILNTRDRENWIRSRQRHIFPMEPRYAAVLGLGSAEQVWDYWRREWEDHHRYVRAYFEGTDRLLVFDIEKDEPAKLVEFLKPDFGTLNAAHWGWHHRTDDQSSSSS